MQEVIPLLDLSFEELSNLCATSSEFRDICENDELWQNMHLRDYGPIKDRKVVSWKLEYLLKRNRTRLASPIFRDRVGHLQELSLPFEHDSILKISVFGYILLLLTDQRNLYAVNMENNNINHVLMDVVELGYDHVIIKNNAVCKFKTNQTYETRHLPDALQIFLYYGDRIIYLDIHRYLVFLPSYNQEEFRIPFPYDKLVIRKIYENVYHGDKRDYVILVTDLDNFSLPKIKSLYLKVPDNDKKHEWSVINAPDIIGFENGYFLSTDGHVYVCDSGIFTSKNQEWGVGPDIIDKKGQHILTATGNVYAVSWSHAPIFVSSNIKAIHQDSMVDRGGNILFVDETDRNITRRVTNPVDFCATSISGYLGDPTIWRNPTRMVISYALYQSLVDAKVISKVIYGDRQFKIVYQGMKIDVSPN